MDSVALCMDCGTSWIVQERADLSDYGCLRCGGSMAPIAAPVTGEDHVLSALAGGG